MHYYDQKKKHKKKHGLQKIAVYAQSGKLC